MNCEQQRITRSEHIAKAYATQWHAGQKRKYTGEPYITHPAEVVEWLRTGKHTETQICAGWLHDTIEDAPDDATREYRKSVIQATLGLPVLIMVLGLTDVSKPSDGNRATRKAIDRAHIGRQDADTKTVKLADIISNSVSIMARDPEFAKVYIPEKRLLLDEALREGDPALWAIADSIVRTGKIA